MLEKFVTLMIVFGPLAGLYLLSSGGIFSVIGILVLILEVILFGIVFL